MPSRLRPSASATASEGPAGFGAPVSALRLWLALAALALGGCGEAAEANRAAASDAAASAALPALTGRVVDQADLLPPAEEKLLSAKLEAVERDVGPQFAVVTVPTLGNRKIEEYGNQLLRTWGLGSRERNDGLLLLVAPNERKVRIEVGYGLERRVTDPFAAKVIREQMIPRFSEGKYAAGIAEGADKLIERLRSKAGDQAVATQDMVVQ
jgi:uncharacterized protein